MHPLQGVCVIYIYPYPYIRPSDLTQSCKSNGPLVFIVEETLFNLVLYLPVNQERICWFDTVL